MRTFFKPVITITNIIITIIIIIIVTIFVILLLLLLLVFLLVCLGFLGVFCFVFFYIPAPIRPEASPFGRFYPALSA